MSGQLEELSAAQRALAEVETPAEAKALYDQLETLSQYARRYRLDHDKQNEIAETKLRTARKGGQLLSATVQHGGPTSRGASLPDGFTWSMSSRWQAVGRLPADDFEAKIVALREQDLTMTAMLRATKEQHRESLREQNRQLVMQAPRLADVGEQFPTIALDPPWDPKDQGDVDVIGRANPTYAVMPIAEIAAEPIGELAATNCHLYLWITNRALPGGFGLLERWGFRYVTMLTWVKPNYGIGNYFRGSTEHILFGVRGSLPLLRNDVGTHFHAERPRRHSQKPEAFYELVESCSPGPWFEWPARRSRNGWVVSGAEVPA